MRSITGRVDRLEQATGPTLVRVVVSPDHLPPDALDAWAAEQRAEASPRERLVLVLVGDAVGPAEGSVHG